MHRGLVLLLAMASVGMGQVPHAFDGYYPELRKTTDRQILMNPMDIPYELKEVERQVNETNKFGAPYIFGKVNDLKVDILAKAGAEKHQSGTLHSLGFGMMNALSFAFYFEEFHIPEGAALFLVSDQEVAGPWTSENNWDSGVFQTRHVKGNYVEVQYFQGADLKVLPVLKVGKVTTAFRSAMAGTCNINAVCIGANNRCAAGCVPTDRTCSIQCTYYNQDPSGSQWAGEDWEPQVLGTVAMGRSFNSRYCSGSFINNPDGKQYVLTAAHCGPSGSDIVQVGFANPDCSSPSDTAGPTNMVAGNLRTLSRNSVIDNELIEVGEAIPPAWNVFLNGWEAGDRTNPAPATVGIHHPAGGNKKISHSDMAVTPTSWSGGGNDHWRVEYWTEATTEPGSSGSPLFNRETKRIIGQLHGGSAACPAQNGYDSYGAVWAGYEDGMKEYLGASTSMDGAYLHKRK